MGAFKYRRNYTFFKKILYSYQQVGILKEIKYARLIRKFQKDLGLELSDFKCLH